MHKSVTVSNVILYFIMQTPINVCNQNVMYSLHSIQIFLCILVSICQLCILEVIGSKLTTAHFSSSLVGYLHCDLVLIDIGELKNITSVHSQVCLASLLTFNNQIMEGHP